MLSRVRARRMVEDMVAVFIVVGEIRPIVAIQVAAEDGLVADPVAVLERGVARGRIESAVERHAVLQLERPVPVASASIFRWWACRSPPPPRSRPRLRLHPGRLAGR